MISTHSFGYTYSKIHAFSVHWTTRILTMEKQELLNQIYQEIEYSDGELEYYKIVFKGIFGVGNYISGNNIA